MSDNRSDLAPGPETRRAKFEIRTVLAIVVLLIVVGGLYVFLFGSPTRNRTAVDSLDINPFPGTRAPAAAPPGNPPRR